MVTVNVVVLAGTVAAEPVQHRMPSGDEVTDHRMSRKPSGRHSPEHALPGSYLGSRESRLH
jgi:hypothetical protein